MTAEWAAKELPADVDAVFQDVYHYMEKKAYCLQTFKKMQKEVGTKALKVLKQEEFLYFSYQEIGNVILNFM